MGAQQPVNDDQDASREKGVNPGGWDGSQRSGTNREEVTRLLKAFGKLLDSAEAAQAQVVPELRECQADPRKENELDIKRWVVKVIALDRAAVEVISTMEALKIMASDHSDTSGEIYGHLTGEVETRVKAIESNLDHAFFLVQRQRISESILNEWGLTTDVYGRVRTTEFAEKRRTQPSRQAKRAKVGTGGTPMSTIRAVKARRLEEAIVGEASNSNMDRDPKEQDHQDVGGEVEENRILSDGSEYASGESDVEFMDQGELLEVKDNRDTSDLKDYIVRLGDRLKRLEMGINRSNNARAPPQQDRHAYTDFSRYHFTERSENRSEFRRHRTQEEFDLHCLRSEVVEGKLICRCEPHTAFQANSCSSSSGNELARYNGKCPADWKIFTASFNALVGLNPRYPPIVKYNILKSKVDFRDEKMITDRSITSRSYARSWEWLHQSHAKPMSCLNYIRTVLATIHIRIDRASLTQVRKLWDGVCELKEANYNMKEDDLRAVIMGTLSDELRRNIRASAEVGRLGGYRNIAADDLAREIFDFVTAEVEDQEAHESAMRQFRPAPQFHPFGNRIHGDGRQQSRPDNRTGGAGPIRFQGPSCYFCLGAHKAVACTRYQSTQSRVYRARDKGLCNKCLIPRHNGECRIGPCRNCGERHHLAICGKPKPRATGGNTAEIGSRNVVAAIADQGRKEQIEMPSNLFMTLDLLMSNGPKGTAKPMRVALDTHSSTNFITVERARELGLKLEDGGEMPANIFGNISNAVKAYKTVAHMHLKNNKINPVTLYAIDEIISPYPMLESVPQEIDELFKWDPSGSLVRRAPDILLGLQDTLLLQPQTVEARLECGLTLMQTIMGYIVCGSVREDTEATALLINRTESKELTPEQRCIKQLYDMEHLGVADEDYNKTEEDVVTERFKRELSVDQSGRYQVMLPVKDCITELGSNKYITMQMTESLRRRILKDKEAQEAYKETFEKYLEEGILVEVHDDKLPEGAIGEHYLPHHPVRKLDSNTTKIRIVVNPTTKSSKSGISFNDAMFKGRTDLPTIFGIMLRSRTYPILTISDVEKAFLQLTVHPSHRPLCRLLYWKDISKPMTRENIRVFEFQRLCFGLKPSPFLLQQTIRAHLERKDPVLGREIIKDMYVDNITVGAENSAEAQRKAERAVELFGSAKMKLREFVSNGNITLPEGLMGNRDKVKFLGTGWMVEEDLLVVKVPILRFLEEITMSVVLGDISSLYDLLGLALPLLTKLKAFFQSLWPLKLRWRQPFPQEKKEEWLQLAREWNGQEIRFPRYTKVEEGDELHVFSDASAIAMGAVVYVVSKGNSRPPMIVAARGQIAPLNKERTIPQKELGGANIGVRLAESVNKELGRELRIISWIDNEAVIHWIKSGAPRQPLAINNLLKRIWESSVRDFNYVPTDANPADIISRGCHPSELDQSRLWRHGPEFLSGLKEGWPTKLNVHIEGRPFDPSGPDDLVILATAQREMNPVITMVYKHSNFDRAIRVVQCLLRPFLRKNVDDMTQETLRARALRVVHKLDQDVWPPSDDQRKDLGIYLDSEGILRSKGRISEADLVEGALHPIFVSDKSPLARSLIQKAHEELGHQGPGATLHKLRYKYWIPRGKRTTAGVLRHCAKCRLWLAKPFLKPPSEQLPKERVEIQPPFRNAALDMFGPLKVFAGRKCVKRYVIIFTCMTVRAIHLEVANSQSGEDFLLAFRRFKAIRGVPKFIQSDNGRNFIKAHDLIQRDHEELVWKFIDPRSPWQNGVVERLVGITKEAFYRSKPRFRGLKDIELGTVIKEIQSAVNQRPLYPRGDDRDALQPLRPIDFLSPAGFFYLNPRQGEDNDISDPSYVPESERRKRKAERAADAHDLQQLHNYLSQVLEVFWGIWIEEYLMGLRERERTPRRSGNVRTRPIIGEIVMMQKPIQDRSQWLLAQITAILPTKAGTDPAYVVVRRREGDEWKYEKVAVHMLFPLEDEDMVNESNGYTGQRASTSETVPGDQEKKYESGNRPGPSETLDTTQQEADPQSHQNCRRTRRPTSRYPKETFVTFMVVTSTWRARGGLVRTRSSVRDNTFDFSASSSTMRPRITMEKRPRITYEEPKDSEERVVETTRPRPKSQLGEVRGMKLEYEEYEGRLVRIDIESLGKCNGTGDHLQCRPAHYDEIIKEWEAGKTCNHLYELIALWRTSRATGKCREKCLGSLKKYRDVQRSARDYMENILSGGVF
ncbi:unnamed protein product [Bursaphelenchus xylophilus]|uniref:(pine wood nematode) hypothetical protein n=1 Tax=Bursaphelenchus xylophilus TaxID=6326 RepID=A0A1I7SM87_BURXY|nr:unnamed protein product [Bursaphelenchus xylophilus]CAG9130046.1 unnamed protein product [Bursaphelenchus xylophilus]